MCDCDCEYCQQCEEYDVYDFEPIEWDDLTPLQKYMYHYLYPRQINLYDQLTKYNEFASFEFRRWD